MAKSVSERQRDLRVRRGKALARAEKMEQSLLAIVEALDGNDKPLAVKVRALALEGLK